MRHITGLLFLMIALLIAGCGYEKSDATETKSMPAPKAQIGELAPPAMAPIVLKERGETVLQ